MLNWPLPTSLKSLIGFLGLTGYYRKFICNYGKIATPMTSMLKKNYFKWDEVLLKAFEKLKQAVSQPPLLVLFDFSKTFVIECDASGCSICVVLMQEGRPTAFLSQALKGKVLHLSTYEKELIALVMEIKKWRPYLLGRPFKIKTDNQNLKFLLE